jgi:hypothetical protein
MVIPFGMLTVLRIFSSATPGLQVQHGGYLSEMQLPRKTMNRVPELDLKMQ